MKAYLYKEDGSREAVEPAKLEEGFTLRRLRGFVKGPIDIIPVNVCGDCGSSKTLYQPACGECGSRKIMVLVHNAEGGFRDWADNPATRGPSGAQRSSKCGTAPTGSSNI